jgi:hypothetical protein
MAGSSCMLGVKTLARKERSPLKPDIWTNEKHSIFSKYRPERRDLNFE